MTCCAVAYIYILHTNNRGPSLGPGPGLDLNFAALPRESKLTLSMWCAACAMRSTPTFEDHQTPSTTHKDCEGSHRTRGIHLYIHTPCKYTYVHTYYINKTKHKTTIKQTKTIYIYIYIYMYIALGHQFDVISSYAT